MAEGVQVTFEKDHPLDYTSGPPVESGTPRPASTAHSGHWGLAALFIGGVVLLMVPLLLLPFFLGTALAWNNPDFDDSAMSLAATGSTVLVSCLIGVSVLALACGILGLTSALFRGQPAGLPVAGTLLSGAGLVFSIILMIVTVRLQTDLEKNHKQRNWEKFYPNPRPSQPMR
jgi:hypothetical protein